MPPVKPTSTTDLRSKTAQPRVGENVVVKPTPTQEENDMAAAGVYIERHEWDGSPIQNIYGSSPPELPELPPPVGQAPTISSLNPNTAVVGGADLTMTVNGSGFTPSSVIVWNGGDEPTTYGSASQVSTGVKPSTASGPYTVPIAVRNGDKVSNELPFTFTA